MYEGQDQDASSKLLHGVLDAVQDVVVIQYPDHTVERYNEAGRRMLARARGPGTPAGGSAAQVQHDGPRIWCFELLGRTSECEQCATRRARETGQTERLEKYVPELDLYLDCTSVPIFDEHGELFRIVEQLKDVSEHKRTERQLRTSESYLRAIIACAPLPIASIDLEGRVTSWNSAAEHVFGWTEEELLGKPLAIVPPDKLKEHLETRRRMLAGERIAGQEVLRLKKSGEPVNISLSTSAMYDERGAVIGFMAALEDISERKLNEAALVQAKEQAEAANRAKSAFLANLSHEIRTPLNGMLGMLQVLESSGLNAEQRSSVELAMGSVDRLDHLLSDLLNLSKIEAEQLEPLTVEFSMGELMQELCEEFRVAAGTKGLDLECTPLDQTIPHRLLGDRLRLRQIVFNLLGNAVKFTHKGKVHISVHKLKEEGSRVWLLLQVADTGIGIAQQHLGRVFEPFYRAEGAFSRSYEGAGLGLPLVHRFVRLMGGRVSVDSTPGVGTTVSVTLPFELPAAVATPGVTRTPDTTSGAATRSEATRSEATRSEATRSAADADNALRILVAEDDRVNQLVLRKLLAGRGHQVEVAGNGQEAVDLFAQQQFDCILMDIQMPLMNGVEATQAIRDSETLSTRPRSVIIAVTAHAMDGDRERFLAAGMDAYLSKPVKIEALEQLFVEQRLLVPKPHDT